MQEGVQRRRGATRCARKRARSAELSSTELAHGYWVTYVKAMFREDGEAPERASSVVRPVSIAPVPEPEEDPVSVPKTAGTRRAATTAAPKLKPQEEEALRLLRDLTRETKHQRPQTVPFRPRTANRYVSPSRPAT